MTHLDLTCLNKQQLTSLLWELKGTPAVHAVYQEFRSRPTEASITISDPDWDNKTDEILKQSLDMVHGFEKKA